MHTTSLWTVRRVAALLALLTALSGLLSAEVRPARQLGIVEDEPVPALPDSTWST